MKKTTQKLETIHHDLLHEIDIKTVIDYFGSTELLDNIGFSAITFYLKACQEDRLYEGAK